MSHYKEHFFFFKAGIPAYRIKRVKVCSLDCSNDDNNGNKF